MALPGSERRCCALAALALAAGAALPGCGLAARRDGGTVLATFPDGVYDIAFSADGKTLAVSGAVDRLRAQRTVQLWDAERGSRRLVIPYEPRLTSPTSIAFSPDGQQLVGASQWGIGIWNLSAGSRRSVTLTPPTTSNGGWTQQSPGPLFFGRDNTVFAIGLGWFGDGPYMRTVWSLQDATRIRRETLPLNLGPKKDAQSIALSSDGGKLAIGVRAVVRRIEKRVELGDSLGIEIYDLQTGKRLQTLPQKDFEAGALTFSEDGRLLAAGNRGGRCLVWDVASGRIVRMMSGLRGKSDTYSYLDSAGPLAFSPDGTILAAGRADGRVKLYSVRTGLALRALDGHRAAVARLRFSPNGSRLASADAKGTIILWNVTR